VVQLNGLIQKKVMDLLQEKTEKMFFAHFSQINVDGYKTLEEGQKVSYDVVQGQKGPQAENISIL
jgi:cold shock CspA family protein